MLLYLYALRGPSGLFSFAISRLSDANDIYYNIISDLEKLLEIKDISNKDEINSYCDLILSSDVVRLLEFNTGSFVDLHSIFKLSDFSDITDLVNDIKNKEVDV